MNAVRVAGMIGEDFRETGLVARSPLHPFPEMKRFFGVVAREGHQEQADVIRRHLAERHSHTARLRTLIEIIQS